MSIEAESEGDVSVAERLAGEQMRLVAAQGPRTFLSVLFLDAFLVWLLSREGLLYVALAWVATGTALQTLRVVMARRAARGTGSMRSAARRLTVLVGCIGLVRASITPVLFALPITTTHYVFTMVLIGQMAGAVGSVCGLTGAYLAWGAPLAIATAAAWGLQESAEGGWIAVLFMLLFGVLASYVRENARTTQALIVSTQQLRVERDHAETISRQNQALADSLRTERDRVAAVSRSKTRFFAAASHDLRQPLHALSINATTLEVLSRRSGDPMIKDLSQGINRALAQSNGLLDGLLDISRLDAGAVEVTPAEVDVGALVAQVAEEFLPAAIQGGLALQIAVAGIDAAADTMGGRRRALWIRSDADLLRRILNNLVSNALKFTSTGHIRLFADIEDGVVEGTGPTVVFGVADSGSGIAAAEHERVFEEFYQVGNASRDRSLGLGLGLSIVRRSAELLSIGLELSSRPGHGTQVVLRAPAIDPPPVPMPIVLREGSAESRIGAMRPRVLVIDDEPEILHSVRHLLTLLGCEVACASSSRQALSGLDPARMPRVLLVDYRLRGETGLQAIEALRQRVGPAAALLVTGDTSPGYLQELGASGCRVLHKPLNGLRLAEAICDALDEVVAA